MAEKVQSNKKVKVNSTRSTGGNRSEARVDKIRIRRSLGRGAQAQPKARRRLSLAEKLRSLAKFSVLRFFEVVGIEFEYVETPTSYGLRAAYAKKDALEREVLLQQLRILQLRTDLGVEMIRSEGAYKTIRNSRKPIR